MVDTMVADQEITPVRLHGKLVRFYLPDVLREVEGERANVEEEGGKGI
jgi:hypothetical protein